MTAIRETFEETGVLLLASESGEELQELPQQSPPPSPSLSEAALDASRESIHTGRTLFRDFLKEHALSADVKALLPFTEWITPLGSSRCVHAPFSHNSHTQQHAMLTTATTAASTHVSTSLSCPLSARPRHGPAGGSHHHSHSHRE